MPERTASSSVTEEPFHKSNNYLVEMVKEGEQLSLDKAVNWVECSRAGAVATFSGVVRDNSEGREVDHLEYEAYVPMAISEMEKICQSILESEQMKVSKIFMSHRVGQLKIGESAVVIAVSAPHRADAINASRTAIDELKKQVPIFKKEVFRDGEVWKSNRP